MNRNWSYRALGALIAILLVVLIVALAQPAAAHDVLPESELCQLARDHGGGIPPGLLVAQIYEESGGQPAIESSAGAVGLMQIIERFHPGVNLRDAATNVQVGAHVLASDYLYLNHVRAHISLPDRVDLYDWSAEVWVKRALAGYVMGPGNVVWYDQHGDKAWPPEVIGYTVNIWEPFAEGRYCAA